MDGRWGRREDWETPKKMDRPNKNQQCSIYIKNWYTNNWYTTKLMGLLHYYIYIGSRPPPNAPGCRSVANEKRFSLGFPRPKIVIFPEKGDWHPGGPQSKTWIVCTELGCLTSSNTPIFRTNSIQKVWWNTPSNLDSCRTLVSNPVGKRKGPGQVRPWDQTETNHNKMYLLNAPVATSSPIPSMGMAKIYLDLWFLFFYGKWVGNMY